MVLFFWFLGPQFLRLFGEGYEEALWPLRWLSLGHILFAAFGPGGMVLQMIHEERASILVLGGILLLGLPLSALLALGYGIQGAALAKLATLAAAGLGSYLMLRRRKGIDVRPWRGAS